MPVNEHVWGQGPGGLRQRRVDEFAGELPAGAFTRLSAGDGTKGPRLHDWARLPIRPGSSGNWPLVRRSIADPTDRASYLCHGRPSSTLAQLVRAPGSVGPSRKPSKPAKAR